MVRSSLMAFSVIEKILFLLLGAISAYLFWIRFGKVWNKIIHSKKDPGFTIHPIARRTWEFFSEVICQSKVIKERPLPGLAHAFVFWGFCAFALVTMNHVAMGFGLTAISRDRVFGRLQP